MSANIADFIALEGIDSDNAEHQTVIALQKFQLFGDAIGYEIKYSGFGKILRERPGIPLARQVSAASIPQDYMNPVPLAHTFM